MKGPPVISAAAAAAVIAIACGGAPEVPAISPSSGQAAYERVVTPFEVRGMDGTAYDHPLLGGLNLPRPQLVDIDSDGDLDLFIQEYTDKLMFFEQVESSGARRFVWKTDNFQDLSVGEWYRFADTDDDGDYDLLAEEPFSYIRYYRNEGAASGQPALILATDSLKDVEGAAIFSDRQNIPNATDIDCDGRLDLLIGRLTGTITRYEEASGGQAGIPPFKFVGDRFQDIEIVAQIGSLHGANTMALVDIDGDGDQDLFWGDFFEPGVLFIENTGSCTNPVLRSDPTPFPTNDPIATSGYNAPAFGDIDGDDDLDMIVGVLGGAFNPNRTSVDNLLLLENTNGEFHEVTSRLVTNLDVGSESIPTFVDLDGDDDLDLLVANKIDPQDLQTSRIYHFENVGNDREPSFQLRGPLEFSGSYHYAPAFADLDADGDQDIIMGTWRDELAYIRNDGSAASPRFVVVDSVAAELTRGSNATPALVDIDADGDFDLFVGEASGTINFYLNVGTTSAPRFELVSDRYGEIDVGRRSFPSFADLDRDGDQDMIVGTESAGLVQFRNDGDSTGPLFVPDSSLAIHVPPFATPTFVDIDADGDLDFFTGGIGGGVIEHQNNQIRR